MMGSISNEHLFGGSRQDSQGGVLIGARQNRNDTIPDKRNLVDLNTHNSKMSNPINIIENEFSN